MLSVILFNMKTIYYHGLRFCKDEKTGYYLNSNNSIRLHRYIYQCEKGDIPKGCHIHHIDSDKSNNSLDNLVMLTQKEHMSLHSKEPKRAEASRANMLENAIPAAAKWHKSEEGRAWHKVHYLQYKDALHRKHDFICGYCGEWYSSIRAGYCCNACKSAARRKSGVDNEQRGCLVCGKEFTVDKYAKTLTCSKTCGGLYRREIKKNREVD